MDEAKRGELRAHFQRFDADSNGAIDQAEFGQLLVAIGVRLTAEQVQVAFSAIDIDASGQIDFGEFCQWWSSQ